MRRGEVVIAAGVGYADKPRSCIVMQSDEFSLTDSVTVCLVTSREVEAADLGRVPVALPPGADGVAKPSWAMVDKLMSIKRSGFRQTIGQLTDDEMAQISRAIIVFLKLV